MFKNGARYNSIGPWMTSYFGKRTVKAAIDAGFTCPNRDGTKGTGGCIYCSGEGSGEYAGIVTTGSSADGRMAVPIKCETPQTELPYIQIDSQLSFISAKWPDPLCLAYFQNFTNTYAPAEHLRALYENALSHPDCVGIAIATRPDCISPEVMDLLSELNERTFLWIELGLQTVHDRTAELINRCCSLSEYDSCISELRRRNIRYVTHLIFGLPGESRDEMLESVRYTADENLFGIKMHMLNILKNTPIENMYRSGMFTLPEKEEYISLIADAIEIIPPEVTLHRITGDAPYGMLVAPEWAADKRSILNGVNKELKKRGSIQGCRYRKY